MYLAECNGLRDGAVAEEEEAHPIVVGAAPAAQRAGRFGCVGRGRTQGALGDQRRGGTAHPADGVQGDAAPGAGVHVCAVQCWVASTKHKPTERGRRAVQISICFVVSHMRRIRAATRTKWRDFKSVPCRIDIALRCVIVLWRRMAWFQTSLSPPPLGMFAPQNALDRDGGPNHPAASTPSLYGSASAGGTPIVGYKRAAPAQENSSRYSGRLRRTSGGSEAADPRTSTGAGRRHHLWSSGPR